jgi:beta-mannan synthase
VVEDMDLSLRAYLKGWKSLYLPHVDNPNELPASLSSYKTQQFRCGGRPLVLAALLRQAAASWQQADRHQFSVQKDHLITCGQQRLPHVVGSCGA